MNELIDIVLILFLLIFSRIAHKIWKALDSYLIKKAENYATKQDVTQITKRTEEIQSEFYKIRSEFDTDLNFRYGFYENQYKELYSQLYILICKSEALRYILKKVSEDSYEFRTFPIVEYASSYDEKESRDKPVIEKIIELVLQKHIYSSPELIKLVCTFEAVNNYEKRIEMEEQIVQLEKKLKIEIIEVISKDFYWLRDKLHLQDSKDMIEELENNRFINV